MSPRRFDLDRRAGRLTRGGAAVALSEQAMQGHCQLDAAGTRLRQRGRPAPEGVAQAPGASLQASMERASRHAGSCPTAFRSASLDSAWLVHHGRASRPMVSTYDEAFTGGFRRLSDQGWRYDTAWVDHAPILSYPGHNTLATGAHPRPGTHFPPAHAG